MSDLTNGTALAFEAGQAIGVPAGVEHAVKGRPRERVVSISGPRDGGGVVVRYCKLHLFAEGKHCFELGDLGLSVFEIRWGIVGICVSYELRFVEAVRILALRGAVLVCMHTVWVTGSDRKPRTPTAYAPEAEGAVLLPKPPKKFLVDNVVISNNT